MPLDLIVKVERPFPGLRPFEPDDALVFFGREQHTAELLRRFSTQRFLAVVGTSGSGKSSLIRAGLLPALYRGQLTGATTHWRIAIMKPGDGPLANLSEGLADADALGPDLSGDRAQVLRASTLGLVDVVGGANLAAGESLLVVVDQFEELFGSTRTDDANAEAALFVALLLNAVDAYDVPVYVVLTMRSDFLGECSRFTGLAEALSRSQYLIPRLSRDERQQAIERPLGLAGADPTPALVQQLLNDSSEDAALGDPSLFAGTRSDPLPVLQHALMKTFEEWLRMGGAGPLTLDHYRAVGGVEHALDRHAESVYANLTPNQQHWAEKIYRCVTTTHNGRQGRRPTARPALHAVAGATTPEQQNEVDAVLERFLRRDDSLLVASRPDRIDIPHEALIGKWQRLQHWVKTEAESAAWYRDLSNAVREHALRRVGLWRDPNLRTAQTLAARDGWNAAWAVQYVPTREPSFDRTHGFLADSSAKQTRERWAWWLALALVVAGAAMSIFLLRQYQSERLARQISDSRLQTNQTQLDAALAASLEATRAREELQNVQAVLPPGNPAPEDKARLDDLLRREEEARKTVTALQQERQSLASSGNDLAAVNERLRTSLDKASGDYVAAVGQIDTLRKDGEAKDKELQQIKQERDRLAILLAEARSSTRILQVRGGMSIGPLGDTSREGTSCCVVRDAKGVRYIVGHVYFLATVGASITQPAASGGAGATEVIGKVTRRAPVGLTQGLSVSLVELSPGVQVSSTVGDVRIAGTASPRVGDAVKIYGVSGTSSGAVESVDQRVRLTNLAGRDMEVAEVVVVQAKVSQRDGGAPVLDQDNRLVGMVLSSSGSSQVYVLPIGSILKAFNVELLP